LTFHPSVDTFPIWTDDGQYVVFSSRREGALNIFAQAANGTGSVQRLTTSLDNHSPAFVDGMSIVGNHVSPATISDVVRFPSNRQVGQRPSGSSLSGTNEAPLVRAAADEIQATLPCVSIE
jgi:Tol biopolymer transport system component